MLKHAPCLPFAFLLALAGCTTSGPPSNPSDGGATPADAGRVDASSDVASGCTYQSDCPEGEFCDGSTCRPAPSCRSAQDWETCVDQFAESDEDLAQRAVCRDDRCQVACTLDRHCRDGRVCTDYGRCRSFDGDLEAEPPGGASQTPLQAGVGRALLEFPIGLPLGGYGSRAGVGSGRYADQLRASHGQMHGLYARAILLDNGARQLMMIRLPVIFSSMALHEAVARRLQEATGANWRDSLVVSATHTHSGPARFYHLPDETLIPVGRFGIGSHHQKAFDWLVDSTVRAAKDALDDRAPASLGIDVVEDFDPDDRISSDRWEQTPPFDDNRLLVMRIDDPEGTPRAVAVSFGTHGTIHSDDYFNGDAPGAIEDGLERALAETYDRPVPVLFFNQNGGTMSPGGNERGHSGPQRFEKLGDAFADVAMPHVEELETRRQVSLDGETHRFPMSYDLLGYESGEWGRRSLETVDQQYLYGGIQCSGQPVDDDYATSIEPSDLDCFGLHRILYHRPPTLFLRSQITALEIGRHTMVTLPGEASMEIGWQVVRRLRERHGLDPARTWTLGYAQDHQFYLMPTDLRGPKPSFSGFEDQKAPESYPDDAFSYLQGGYEPSMSFWGWRFGDYLVDRAADAVARLRDEAPSRDLPSVRPALFSRTEESFPVEPSAPEAVGDVVQKPPERVERFETIEFAWIGGDPGVEMPQAPRAILERRTDGSFEPIETSRDRPYDNREPVMLTRRRRSEDGNWIWIVYWQEGRDFPTGRYRFRVEGHHRVEGERRSYETTSRAFDVVPNDELRVSISTDGATIEGQLGYPPAEKLQYTETSDDPGSVEGDYRMRHPEVPTGVVVPLDTGEEAPAADVAIELRSGGQTVTSVSGSDVTVTTGTRTAKGVSGVPTTRYEADVGDVESGTYRAVVTVTDAQGNTGRIETEVTLP